MPQKIKVTLVKSMNGRPEKHRKILEGMGLRKINKTIELQDTDMYADSLTILRDITVTIDGGYNCDYTGKSGITTINGNITVTTGTLILEDIILQ